METETKFYMVWNPNGRAPTFKHETKDAACKEAERLANQVPGQTFYVLSALEGVVVQKPVTRFKLKDRPDPSHLYSFYNWEPSF